MYLGTWRSKNYFYAILISFSQSVLSESNNDLEVVFPSYILGFSSYLRVNDEGRLAGALIDHWECIFSRLDIDAHYQLLPPKRAAHQFITREAVIYGAKIRTKKKFYSLPDGAAYSNELSHIYALLLVLEDNAELLDREEWWELELAGIEASSFNLLVYDKYGELKLKARHIDQLIKMLLGERVDAVLLPSLYPIEEYLASQRLPLAGRTIETASIHGVLSGHLLRMHPMLLVEVNESAVRCALK
ncbi:MAG: hypothetical protein CL693_06485 [Cellvibrionaceae bacterium]|nr:hypothetical protein [Cellvibrionaceae bacterium]|tara:strand:+ start:61405 stop:62139 length:735 start_codon:yes stop_codon:yes gene_type:complete